MLGNEKNVEKCGIYNLHKNEKYGTINLLKMRKFNNTEEMKGVQYE